MHATLNLLSVIENYTIHKARILPLNNDFVNGYMEYNLYYLLIITLILILILIIFFFDVKMFQVERAFKYKTQPYIQHQSASRVSKRLHKVFYT